MRHRRLRSVDKPGAAALKSFKNVRTDGVEHCCPEALHAFGYFYECFDRLELVVRSVRVPFGAGV
jgi:hypothetical protein|tara:strand:+ start:113 stop:307 length:195 start_codon:yes stop_codon:yes gene_type:complete